MDAYPKLQELVSITNKALNFILQRLHSQTLYMFQATYIDIIDGIMGAQNALLNESLVTLIQQYENTSKNME
jgi:hypothetical protein